MKLIFKDHPYAGRDPRPTPEIFIDSALNTLIVAVPWGARSAAKKVIERMVEYLSFASQDREATSPLPRLSCLSTAANNLRTATMLANDMLYREDNRDEYRVGVEVFAATLSQNEFSWVQVGGPQIILARNSSHLVPLGSGIDLARDLSLNQALPSLPAQLLGLDASVNMTINSFRARAGDRLILLSHSHTPASLYSVLAADVKLELLVRTIALQQSSSAFWLGLLTVESEASDSSLDLQSGDVA